MLIDRWHPVTHDFGLIQAPLDRVVTGLLSWHGSIDIGYERAEVASSFEDALRSLLPLSVSKQRKVFVQTCSEWIAYYQNGIKGSDPFPAMSYLARQLGVLAMRVCSTPEGAPYPATIWEVYAPEHLGGRPPLGYRRSICAANDGGRWTFHQSGQPFPFERAEFYQKRHIRERFTIEMLREYLAAFGIEPFAEDFVVVSERSPAVRLQQVGAKWNTPEFTPDEVIAGTPWTRNLP